jgi:hypothetical protein
MNGKSVWRQIILLLIMAGAAVFALQWSSQRKPASVAPAGSAAPLTVSVLAQVQGDTLLHDTVEAPAPLSALEALELAAADAVTALGIRDYSIGRLVVSIGDVTAGPEGDWTYTVNGAYVPVGADQYQLADGDRLTFAFGHTPHDSLQH